MKLSLSDIKKSYNGIKKMSFRKFKNGHVEDALFLVKSATTIAQQFNWIYADDDMEDFLCEIGKHIIPSISEMDVDENKFVFYDDFCTSYVLAIQYLEAMVKIANEILYITTKDKKENKFKNIIPLISKLPNIRIVVLPNTKTDVERAKILYDEIVAFKPGKIFLHSKSYSIITLVLSRFPRNIKRYYINLADHSFWLGVKNVDFLIEFRQFGVSVSQQRRGVCSKQQLLVPFYPYMEDCPFKGFPIPNIEKDTVLIYSGCDIYKVLDGEHSYWNIVRDILNKFPQVIFYFTTKSNNLGTSYIENFVKSNHFEQRFFFSEYRSDIKEVMAHCDIYFGTLPMEGALMSLIAASLAKPILQFLLPNSQSDATEQVLCYNDRELKISYKDRQSFFEEAERLIKDKNHRIEQGQKLQKAVIKKDQFDELFRLSISRNKSQLELIPYHIDYDAVEEKWFNIEKAGYINSMSYLYDILGAFNCIRYSPFLFCKKQMNKIIRYFKLNYLNKK